MVKSGDTLTGIASHFGVSMMTIWWANKPDGQGRSSHVGQKLLIPPVDGVVCTVQGGRHRSTRSPPSTTLTAPAIIAVQQPDRPRR